jgi:ketosteroid isomerase-like protein
MAADSVDVVERALGRFLETGEPHWALLDEQLATRDHDLLDAGEYRGHDGHRRWLADWSVAWSDFEVARVVEVVGAGDDVVVVFEVKATGRTSGASVEREDAMVCRVQDGRIACIDYYNNRAQALAQVGLEP